MGHLDNVGVCLDLGHAHMTVGVAAAFTAFGARIASVHVHDNHAVKDEHLWPGDGTIDWPVAAKAIKALATTPAIVIELDSALDATDTLPARMEQSFAIFD
jgi:sugar phosphate isomerase/epimerase